MVNKTRLTKLWNDIIGQGHYTLTCIHENTRTSYLVEINPKYLVAIEEDSDMPGFVWVTMSTGLTYYVQLPEEKKVAKDDTIREDPS